MEPLVNVCQVYTYLILLGLAVCSFTGCTREGTQRKEDGIIVVVPNKDSQHGVPGQTDHVANPLVDSSHTLAPGQLRLRYKGMYVDISGHEGYIELELSAGAKRREYLGKGQITELNMEGHPGSPHDFSCRLFVDSDSTGTLELQTEAMKYGLDLIK